MKKPIFYLTTILFLSGCFFPGAVTERVENELEIEFQKTPRSLLLHNSESEYIKSNYYAIEIPRVEFDSITSNWKKIDDLKSLSLNFSWEEIGIEEFKEWDPSDNSDNCFVNELKNGDIAISQYNESWMYVIKKGKKN